MRVGVYVHPNVRVDSVSNFEEGLEPGRQASTEFHESNGGAWKAVGVDLPQVWDMFGRWSGVLTPWWGVQYE